MKPTYLLLSISLLFLTITACTKSVDTENSGLIGKWKLVEVYNGYANGGNFTWEKVSEQDSHILSFWANGQFNRKENGNLNQQECVGTYQVLANNIEINSNCNTVVENLLITELTATTLKIERSVREGKIRYKYSATK